MQKTTIIVADDDEMVREVLSRQLMEKGYDVRGAADGVEAWELFQKQPSEVLISDLDMPRMNGQELIAKVKEHSPALIVIVLTGQGTLGTAQQVIHLGCDEFLVKPIGDFSQIDLVLKRSIERRQMLMRAIVSQRVNRAKSKMIHEASDALIGPSHAVLENTAMLVSAIREKNCEKSLGLIEKVRKDVDDLVGIVGKFAESSDRLKEMEAERKNDK
jgi:two-component system, NtrC family, sensor kinase